MTGISIVYQQASALLPYARNSRTHSDQQVAQVAASIKEFGFTNPILVDEENMIIAGHGRLLAAQKLGLEQVPTISLKYMTEAQKKAYVIADNKLALNAGWDEELLALEIAELDELNFDLELTGFDTKELDHLLAEANKTDGFTDPDDVPEISETVITQPGNTWTLGSHRLVCADATRLDQVEQAMAGRLADMLLTDPPYNLAYEGGSKKRDMIKNDKMGSDDFRQFLSDSFMSADTVMKNGAVFYIWHAETQGYNLRGACMDVGWELKQTLIWNKDSSTFSRSDYHWKHEPCLYGWKKGAAHLWAGDRKQKTVLDFPRPHKSELHPTMKPVELMEYQILNNTKGADLVLDLFGGSGSTLIAAEKSGRHCVTLELDPAYCDVIVKRWQNFTKQDAVLEGKGETFNDVAQQKDSGNSGEVSATDIGGTQSGVGMSGRRYAGLVDHLEVEQNGS